MKIRVAARLITAGVVVGAAAVAAMTRGGSGAAVVRLAAQDAAPVQREVAVTAKKYAFAPGRIEVNQNDLVRVVLRSDDIRRCLALRLQTAIAGVE